MSTDLGWVPELLSPQLLPLQSKCHISAHLMFWLSQYSRYSKTAYLLCFSECGAHSGHVAFVDSTTGIWDQGTKHRHPRKCLKASSCKWLDFATEVWKTSSLIQCESEYQRKSPEEIHRFVGVEVKGEQWIVRFQDPFMKDVCNLWPTKHQPLE